MTFLLLWALACSKVRPTLVGGVSDSDSDGIYWASDWETAPCPTWAPYDQVDTREWTYRGPSGHHEVTLSTQGTTRYPPILVGGPELVAGSTHVAYMATAERWSGWSQGEVGRWRGYGSLVIASAGVIETGVGSLPAWTITLPRGVEDEALGVSRRAWADDYGAVTIGPTILTSVFPEG